MILFQHLAGKEEVFIGVGVIADLFGCDSKGRDSHWIQLWVGFGLGDCTEMYEIGHDGIQCEFLPLFDLKVSLDNLPTEI